MREPRAAAPCGIRDKNAQGHAQAACGHRAPLRRLLPADRPVAEQDGEPPDVGAAQLDALPRADAQRRVAVGRPGCHSHAYHARPSVAIPIQLFSHTSSSRCSRSLARSVTTYRETCSNADSPPRSLCLRVRPPREAPRLLGLDEDALVGEVQADRPRARLVPHPDGRGRDADRDPPLADVRPTVRLLFGRRSE